MDIKEIALNETKRMQAEGWAIGDSSGVLLVERVIAELAKQNEPVAYLTRNEDGDPAMLFFDEDEARKYSGDDEPIKLIVKPGENK